VERPPRPTNADVARLAEVSIATVSYVLNDTAGRRVSARTREAVRRAAAQLGYRPNVAARNLARGSGGVVLYVVPRVAVGEMPIRAGSLLATELARSGLLQVQIFETEDDRHVVEAVESLDPMAVLSLFPLSDAVRRAVTAARIPGIEIGLLPAFGDPLLIVGALRVGHLVDRGHRRIAFARTEIPKWRTLGDRWLEGVARAAAEHGLPPIVVGDVTAADAAAVVEGWVREGVTAVCAQSDEIAGLVLDGIRRAGLRCPDDLAVVGVDANPLGAYLSPPLTTVEFAPAAVADIAAAATLAELGLPDRVTRTPAPLAELIVRAST
jgi:DNA-binding LacI/PurR family transcriptional regulator